MALQLSRGRGEEDYKEIYNAIVEFSDPKIPYSGNWTFICGSQYTDLTLQISTEYHQNSEKHKRLLLNSISTMFLIFRYLGKAKNVFSMKISRPCNTNKSYLGGFHDILINGVNRSCKRVWNNGYPISYVFNSIEFDLCIIKDLNQITSVPRFMFPVRI
jgi:hypothetical protein